MKKQLLTIVAAGAIGSAFAQLPASTSPQNRKVVLEEFTGIHCQYCPDGHKRADQIKAANPNDVVLVNIHTGGYATPGTGEPDFRTNEGNAIAGMSGMGITGYPAGAISRHVWQGTAMAEGRGTWASDAALCMAQSSPVNVALQGTLNVNTRVLSVQAQAYYTANSTTSTNSLTIILLQNGIHGPQTGGTTWYPANYFPDGSYNHKHVLRKVISTGGYFGMPVTPTTAGSTYNSAIINYTIPLVYGAGTNTTAVDFSQLEIAAFVADNQKEIRTAAYGPIVYSGLTNGLDVAVNSLKTENEICAQISPTFDFVNTGSLTATSVVFSYAINGGAPTNYTWTGTCGTYQVKSIALPVTPIAPLPTNSIVVNVVSVNGSADQNPANDMASKINIPASSIVANNLNMQMDFTQDQYGSEVTWKLYNEVTNALIIQDGPWTDLAAAGTALHTKTWTANSNTCYKLVVADAYGDGVNSGYGVGGYILKSGGTPIYTSNGQYGAGETKLHKTALTAGIYAPQMSLDGVNVYPNPTSGTTNVSLQLTQNEVVNITVYNSIGQEVYTSKSNEFNAGTNTISLNTTEWAAGVYNINISTANGSASQKLTVTK